MVESKNISIIGGMTVNIEGRASGPLVRGMRSPGKVAISYGGVGRDIAENLSRMGQPVYFVSVVGSDAHGFDGMKLLQETGVDISGIRTLRKESTAIFLYVQDERGEIETAISSLGIVERITPQMIDEEAPRLKTSKIVGVDTNLSVETLEHITEKLAGVPLFLDPVSVPKSQRAKPLIGRFHTIKPNRAEAQVLSGISIDAPEDLERAGNWFLEQGVIRVFISLGGGGVFYMEKKEGRQDHGIIVPQATRIAGSTGPGDAFSAAILRGFVLGQDARTAAKYGMAAASIAMESEARVNSALSSELLEKRYQMIYGSEKEDVLDQGSVALFVK